MPVQTWTPGQVLTAAEMTSVTNLLLYPTLSTGNVNPAVAGTLYRMQPAGGAQLTVTLPSPSPAGQTIGVKLDAATSAGSVLISQHASEVMYGPDLPGSGNHVGVTSMTLTIPDSLLVIVSDGTNWHELAFIGGTGWGAPTFTNSWANLGSGFANAGYRMVATRVLLRGVIASGTVGSAAFTLPAGFRPSSLCQFGVESNGAFGQVRVGTDGTVTPQTPSSNFSVSLDGITFDTL